MIGRLWYPQMDVYDAIRRTGSLLTCFESPPGIERLEISDFYFANPPLLHKTNMNSTARAAFNKLKIPQPGKAFLVYPSAPILFQKMEAIQKQALTALSGKDLISNELLQIGKVSLTDHGNELFSKQSLTSNEEKIISTFIATQFAPTEEIGNLGLRRRTGLRRVQK